MALHGLFNLIFPDECRVCTASLVGFSRVPVCHTCLAEPPSIEAEYWCQRCRAPFSTAWVLIDGVCELCRGEQQSDSLRGFDTAYSYGAYEGVLRRLIQLYKYERIHTLSAPLGQLLVAGLPRHESFDFIVPVPLHWRRRWARGFNQAELLARVVAHHTGLPVIPALSRKKITAPQAGLSDVQRRTNTAHAFTANEDYAARVSGKHILIIDDVLTTGATLSAASRVLRRAGARRITVLTVARADRRPGWSLLSQSGSKS